MASAMTAGQASETLYRAGSFASEFPNSVVVTLTSTMLEKSIIDASAPVRDCLLAGGIHDYASQAQGDKVKAEGQLVLPDGRSARVLPVTVSLYRPNTKEGDPRFWVSKLRQYAKPGDHLALGVGEGNTVVITNLSSAPNLDTWRAVEIELGKLAPRDDLEQNLPLERLVRRLQKIAQGGPVPADGTGDTAVGRTMETALGIEMNSSKDPDWEGVIELKFGRPRPAQRRNLFAQVPDWEKSALKSSAEILDAFGYWRDGDFQLNATVGSKANSQGLYLRTDERGAMIRECSTRDSQPEVAVWPLELLQKRLASKHQQTCWIVCEESEEVGATHFLPTEVLYTHSPRVDLIPLLITAGDMTLDHLIKRLDTGGVRERGPLWKVSQAAAPQLLTVADSFRLLP